LDRPFTALAIRTTPKEKSEEIVYDTECFGTRTTFSYLTVYVDELEEDKLLVMKWNPVALAVFCAKRILKAGNDEIKRLNYVKELFRLMKERGHADDARIRLAYFVEGIANLKTEVLLQEAELEMDKLYREVDVMYDQDPYEVAPILMRILDRKYHRWKMQQLEDMKKTVEAEVKAKVEAEVREKVKAEAKKEVKEKVKKAKKEVKEVSEKWQSKLAEQAALIAELRARLGEN